MKDHISGKHVMVTGCCGTVGSELVARLLRMGADDSILAGASPPSRVLGVDNDETGLFFMEQKYKKHDNSEFILGDLRDEKSLFRLMAGVDIVFHCAAFKHVSVCERSPYEAIQTNIVGVQNIVDAALAGGVERVVFTSSDKAVNPTNVMGASKLMGERLITAGNIKHTGKSTVFASARFGNVLGSRGSVVPIFREQIRKRGPVTITDDAMTRFVMGIGQAADLVFDTARLALGGEVFIRKTPAVRIVDLAEVMIEVMAPMFGHDPAQIEVRMIGARHGEKLYEELMSDGEIRHTVELQDYLVILPAFAGLYHPGEYTYEGTLKRGIDHPYHSSKQPFLSREELKSYLTELGLFSVEAAGEHPDSLAWPGERRGR